MIGLLTNRLVISVVLMIGMAVGLHMYGKQQYRAGRADLASEIAVSAAEKRAADAETLEEIENEVQSTSDDGLVDLIVNGGWLLDEED